MSPGQEVKTPRESTPPIVWVIAGGTSSEREVSLQSGEAIQGALIRAASSGAWEGSSNLVPIQEDGRWQTPSGVKDELDAIKDLGPEHVLFIALHGGRGEDGRFQAVLESAGVRYTGSGPAASALCMDKRAARCVFADEGLRVPPGVLVNALSNEDSETPLLLGRLKALSPDSDGWFVKPNTGGSSVGVTLVREASGLLSAISNVIDGGDRALVEARVVGVEASVGVLGIAGRDLRALPAIEIRPQHAEWFDSEEKYATAGAIELCPPERISHDVEESLRLAALRAHVGTGCRGYSRTDFIVAESGELYVLEVNTIPGMTERSLFPQEAMAAGMDFESLCLELLRLASQDA